MPRNRALYAAVAVAAVLGAALALAVAWVGGAFDQSTVDTRVITAGAETTAGGGGSVSWSKLYAARVGGVVTVLVDTGSGGGVQTSGAGFVVDAAHGIVVTNSHVVTNSSDKGVTPKTVQKYLVVYIQRADKARVAARVLGFDLFDDVAVLKFDPAQLPIPQVPLGNSAAVRVGDPVAAIGAPFRQVESLSVGVVSQVGTQIEAPAAVCFRTPDGIQTDAAVNPGNSGGPLFDANGRVIGVTSQIDTSDEPNAPNPAGSGVGFAVPIDAVKQSLAQIRATGTVHYAFLGVAAVTLTPDVVRQYALRTSYGAQVTFVDPGSDALRVGLSNGGTPTALFGRQIWSGGDVITAFDGKPVHSIGDLQHDVAPLKPHTKVQLTWYHAGMTRRTATITLGERDPLDPNVCKASAAP